MKISKPLLFKCLLVLVVVTNIIVMSGIAYNESEKTFTLTLSERELTLPYFDRKEDSSARLFMSYQIYTTKTENNYSNDANWLTKDKMRSLGFSEKSLAVSSSYEHRKTPIARDVYLVLEFNGNSYQERLRELSRDAEAKLAGEEVDKWEKQSATDRLERFRDKDSRLMVIDAGTNFDSLVSQYPEENILIVRGSISTRYSYDEGTSYSSSGMGIIRPLTIRQIDVPLQHRETFKALSEQGVTAKTKAEYQITLTFGKRLEPWIEKITLVN